MRSALLLGAGAALVTAQTIVTSGGLYMQLRQGVVTLLRDAGDQSAFTFLYNVTAGTRAVTRAHSVR